MSRLDVERSDGYPAGSLPAAHAGRRAAAQPRRAVRSPLPDLAKIATDPGELEWIASLPFRYEVLDAEQVIEILLRLAPKPGLMGMFTSALELKARLAVSRDEVRDVAFKLVPGRTQDGRRQIEVQVK